jgi:O-antigen ligase
VIALGSVLAVSRSAVIGLGVAVLATIPALPRRLRAVLIGSVVAMAAVAVAVLPGLMGTVVGLFAASGDASIQSRTDALARVPEFLRTSPLYGTGFGTFLPRYYIFDNEWVLLLVELGIVGALSFAALFGFSMASAARAASGSSDPDWQLLARALAASVLTVAVCFAFFDGLSFPIAAGLAFLLFGVCAAVRAIAVEEGTKRPSTYDNSAILLP